MGDSHNLTVVDALAAGSSRLILSWVVYLGVSITWMSLKTGAYLTLVDFARDVAQGHRFAED